MNTIGPNGVDIYSQERPRWDRALCSHRQQARHHKRDLLLTPPKLTATSGHEDTYVASEPGFFKAKFQ